MGLPKAFRGMVVAVLLCACLCVAWYTVRHEALQAKITDTQTQLTTSRSRELRQQQEYDQAATDLPAAKEELAALQPLADAAAEEEAALRTQRKEDRAAYTALQARLSAARDAQAAAEAALAEALAAAEEVAAHE